MGEGRGAGWAFAEDLQGFVVRDVKQAVVYSDGDQAYYNEDQIGCDNS